MPRNNKLVQEVTPASLAAAFENFDSPEEFVEGIVEAVIDMDREERARDIFGSPTTRSRAASMQEGSSFKDIPHSGPQSESGLDDLIPDLNPIVIPSSRGLIRGDIVNRPRAASFIQAATFADGFVAVESPKPAQPRRLSDIAKYGRFRFLTSQERALMEYPKFLDTIQADDVEKLIYSFAHPCPDVIDLEADRATFSFPPQKIPPSFKPKTAAPVKATSPAQATQDDSGYKKDEGSDGDDSSSEAGDEYIRDATRHESYLDGFCVDTSTNEAEALEDWFSSFPVRQPEPLDELGPVYAQHERKGLVPEEQDTEDKGKDKKPKTLDVSPTFICLIIANNGFLLPYTTSTVEEVGNTPASRYSTTIRIDDRMFSAARLLLAVNICYGSYNVQIATIELALDDLESRPKAAFLTADTLKNSFSTEENEINPTDGAFLIGFPTSNANTTVSFNHRALQELEDLHMPGLSALRNRLQHVFSSSDLNLAIMVTAAWKDFEDWGHKFGVLYADAHLDPYAALTQRSRGQPITVRNYEANLPADVRTVPAKSRFRNVNEALTILGDASAREHAYQQWSAEELANIHCKALMMPIGDQRCVVTRDGKEVQVPYLYSFSVVNSSNPGLFAQLAPAINAGVKIQVEIPYRKVATPVENKTEQQLVQLIARGMHKDLWDHRRKVKTSRQDLDQAWVDDFAELIKPYVKADQFPSQEIADVFAYSLSLKLQKIRANKDENIEAETPKEHHTRTVNIVNDYRNHLKVPVDVTADIPQFTAVRMAHDLPLSRLSDWQFVAYRPKQMGWPKTEAASCPWLDIKEPRLPKHRNHDHLVKLFDAVNSKKLDKYLVSCRFVAVDDDVTAKSKVQGLIKMKEFQATPLVEWFTTFRDNPITTNVTDTFSILRRAMHYHYYDAALPFRETEDVPEDLVFPETLKDAEGKPIEHTTPRFQNRETKVLRHLLKQLEIMSDEQLGAFRLLPKAPFALLEIEGVPGSGKTWLAHVILLGCMYSVIDVNMKTTRQPTNPRIEDVDSDSDSEDEHYNITPSIDQLVTPMPSEQNLEEKKEEEAPEVIDCFDIPQLACGPSKDELEAMFHVAGHRANSHTTFVRAILDQIQDCYYRKFELIRPLNISRSESDRVRDSHWKKWFDAFSAALEHGPETQTEYRGAGTSQELEPTEAAKTTADILKEIGRDQPAPVALPHNPQVLIIANQNINGDDAAQLMHNVLNKELQFDELIIRVTNLDLEQKALKKSFRPDTDNGVRQAPGMADIIHSGIAPAKLAAFANRTGEFAPRKHGGIWTLEGILRQKLEEGAKPALMRQLQRLSNPADVMTKEERMALDNTIKEFIKAVLAEAKVVICTFVVAQSLAHKNLYKPEVALVDEASREPELLIRWAQTALSIRLLILTGDYRQDQPFALGRYTKEEKMKNIFMPQLLTPMTQRVMEERPDCAVFLSTNRRQHGGLEEIASDIFYDGTMRSAYDSRDPSQLAYTYHLFGQELVRDMRAICKDKEVSKGKVAEFLSGNRVTVICNSSMVKRGLSSVSEIQARVALDYAALVHQSHIPGADGMSRPKICIITPYSAQVDEIRSQMRGLSDKELCHDLVEVRTQTASTGGEWDVVILCFVRDGKMGFLSETNRINVMLTRAKFLSIDIFDTQFFDKPHGHNSKVIGRYKKVQVRNGAICRDTRNWAVVCRRCCKPHEKDCREDLKCTFCHENHHARNCRTDGSLDAIINPDVINLAPLDVEEDWPAEDAETGDHDAGDAAAMLASETAPAFNQIEFEDPMPQGKQKSKPARQLDPVLAAQLDQVLNDGTTPLVIEQPMEPQLLHISDDEGEEEEEEEEDDDDFNEYSLGKKSLGKKKKAPRMFKAPTEGIWTKILRADNDKKDDSWGPPKAPDQTAKDTPPADSNADTPAADGNNNWGDNDNKTWGAPNDAWGANTGDASKDTEDKGNAGEAWKDPEDKGNTNDGWQGATGNGWETGAATQGGW